MFETFIHIFFLAMLSCFGLCAMLGLGLVVYVFVEYLHRLGTKDDAP